MNPCNRELIRGETENETHLRFVYSEIELLVKGITGDAYFKRLVFIFNHVLRLSERRHVHSSEGIHEGCRTPGESTIDVYEVPNVTVGYKLASSGIRQCM